MYPRYPQSRLANAEAVIQIIPRGVLPDLLQVMIHYHRTITR
jgi:hypothetical protein